MVGDFKFSQREYFDGELHGGIRKSQSGLWFVAATKASSSGRDLSLLFRHLGLDQLLHDLRSDHAPHMSAHVAGVRLEVHPVRGAELDLADYGVTGNLGWVISVLDLLTLGTGRGRRRGM